MSTLLEWVHYWNEYTIGMSTLLEWVHHWNEYTIGMSTPLEWVHHWNEYTIGMSTPLEWVHYWSEYTIGVSTLLEWVHYWSEYTIGMSTPLEWVHYWSEYTIGMSTLLEWVHYWSEYTIGMSTLLEWVHYWNEYTIGVTTPLEWVHHWNEYTIGLNIPTTRHLIWSKQHKVHVSPIPRQCKYSESPKYEQEATGLLQLTSLTTHSNRFHTDTPVWASAVEAPKWITTVNSSHPPLRRCMFHAGKVRGVKIEHARMHVVASSAGETFKLCRKFGFLPIMSSNWTSKLWFFQHSKSWHGVSHTRIDS